MFAFDTEDLDRWENSDERRRWYEIGAEFALEEPVSSDVPGTLSGSSTPETSE